MDVDLDVIVDFDGDLNLNVVSTFDPLNALTAKGQAPKMARTSRAQSQPNNRGPSELSLKRMRPR
jgi:hypothetical protein